MKSLLFLVCAVLFVGILAAGCTTTPAPVPTPVPTPVATVPTPVPTSVVVVISGPATDPALTGNWNFKGATIAGSMPVIPNVKITLKFNNDGTFTGFGGCNNYNGGYNLTGQTTEFGKTITIGPIASTKMYCADTADLESKYLANLQNTKTYSITNNKMLLRGSGLNELSYDKV
jgi:putative lipoprotein